MHRFYLHIFTCILCALWFNHFTCGYICFYSLIQSNGILFGATGWSTCNKIRITGCYEAVFEMLNEPHESSVWSYFRRWDHTLTHGLCLSLKLKAEVLRETHTHFPEALNHFHNDDDGGRINTGVPQPLYSSIRQCLDV